MSSVWKALVGVSILLFTLTSLGETQSRVSLSQASFVSPDFEIPNKKDYQFIGAGINTLAGIKKEDEIEDVLQAEIRGAVAPGNSLLNYVNVSQLYWKLDQLSVGRKKMVWSQLDENFTLGTFQPVLKWNPLQWESQGLTGFFLHLGKESAPVPWDLTIFGSPLFIPNQGAGYEIQNGSFEESNPYFRAPPSMATFNNQEFRINYTVQKPDTQDVVFRQSYAAKAVLGLLDQGPSLQVAYANKPMNELNLGALGYAPAVLETGAKPQFNVEILPAVSNHTVMSADLQYATRLVRFGVSGMQEQPKSPQFKDEWNYATYKPSTLVSPFLNLEIRDFSMDLAYLAVQGGEIETTGPDAQRFMDYFPERYPFQSAGLIGLKYQYRMKRHQTLGLGTKYLRGSSGEFDLWLTQGSYQFHERWAASLVSQMISVENNSKGKATAYNSYLNNDLVALGVTYVF